MATMNLPSVVFHLAHALGEGNPQAELALALACQATQDGHVCADLDREAGWGPWAAEMGAAQRADFRAALATLPIVGTADEWTPLVWDGRRLYLRRYWSHESRIAADLVARAVAVIPTDADVAIETRLAVLFADEGQRQAARIALTQRLCIVSGGPGTGKTHTLARIIGLLLGREPKLRIALAAPTGKAAARMGEALRTAGVMIEGEGEGDNGKAQTLHRLLGMRVDGRGYYRNREQPLAVDVLVVDEASMIDLSLMTHLLAALPESARLILLGDRDQLAAVEAGAVFADLCASPRLTGCVAMLKTSFRFNAASGIGRFAGTLRRGEADEALQCLEAGGDDLIWRDGDDPSSLVTAREGYAPYCAAVAAGASSTELFERFSSFRVLCALRSDVARVNRALGVVPQPGLPIMVVKNDLTLRLFNGDIGLMLVDPADGALKACFPAADANQGWRWISAVRLPAWEPAWAMTVHKSQGSEFGQVLLILPEVMSHVTTRELVYTGVTRAKHRVILQANADVLRHAIANCAERMSALCEKLA